MITNYLSSYLVSCVLPCEAIAAHEMRVLKKFLMLIYTLLSGVQTIKRCQFLLIYPSLMHAVLFLHWLDKEDHQASLGLSHSEQYFQWCPMLGHCYVTTN